MCGDFPQAIGHLTSAWIAGSSPAMTIENLVAQRCKLHRSVEQSPDEFQRLRSAGRRPAAVGRIKQELVLDVGPCQRLLRAAAHIGLALLDYRAVAQGDADVAG